MTCNPRWPETLSELFEGLQSAIWPSLLWRFAEHPMIHHHDLQSQETLSELVSGLQSADQLRSSAEICLAEDLRLQP